MSSKLKFLILLSATFFVIEHTCAQTRYLMKTVDIVVPSVLDVVITSGANQIVDFNETGKIDNGIELLSATTITYRSNKAWFVSIKAASANFSGGLAGTPMPASVIGYRLSGTGSTYTPLSASASTLFGSSSSKLPRGTGSGTIDFKINPGYIYPPAQDYTLQIIYTISNL